MTEKFFVRGNLALDWPHVLAIAPWCKCVTVDDNGFVFCWESIPGKGNTSWYEFAANREIIGCVGEQCPDWQVLIFERPQAPPQAERRVVAVVSPGGTIMTVGAYRNGRGELVYTRCGESPQTVASLIDSGYIPLYEA